MVEFDGLRNDWADGEPDTEDYEYERLHVEVAECAAKALGALSVSRRTLDATSVDGWSSHDSTFLAVLYDVQFLTLSMAPPPRTPLESRQLAGRLLCSLYDAMPFASSERRWLIDTVSERAKWSSAMAKHTEARYVDAARGEAERIIVNGEYQQVSARELLFRHWAWRRELGPYGGGEGLAQARSSLADFVTLLRPTLELPASYVERAWEQTN